MRRRIQGVLNDYLKIAGRVLLTDPRKIQPEKPHFRTIKRWEEAAKRYVEGEVDDPRMIVITSWDELVKYKAMQEAGSDESQIT